MCGIFGIVYSQDREDLGQILTEAAKRLVYRGYDSVGIATIRKDKSSEIRKDVGVVDEVAIRLNFTQMKGFKGIVQLRWATFGKPSQKNAQPHYDCDKDMIGAHNGNIVNTVQLRNLFLSKGHIVRSENDGEIVVHAIEMFYDQLKDMNKAIQEASKILKGDFACVIARVDDEKMYCIKRGSSLYLGVGDGFVCASSDLPSLIPLTRRIVPLKDGEYVEFTYDNYTIRSLENGEVIHREPQVMDISSEAASKLGYEHYMIKEIKEQPERLSALFEFLRYYMDISKYVNMLNNARNVFLVGSGSSYHAALAGSYFFNKIAKKAVFACEAGRFLENYGDSLSKEDVVVLVSQSGETKDIINVLNHVENKATVLSIVNVMGSTVMMRSQLNIPLCCELEISVPATKTFVNQLAVFYYLASKMSFDDTYLKAVKTIPELVKKSIEVTEPQILELIDSGIDFADSYMLGYGIMHPIALEGALKIKEVVYNHVEGLHSSEFKHGPLSRVKDGYPVFFITHSSQASIIISHINETTCRGGLAIAVSNKSEEIAANVQKFVEYPDCPWYISVFLATVPLQLFAYHLALKYGNNPDLPRNLSKTITVD
ncbi:glutamine--fructose-6-phosphate transaminase (isomerizing) [Pseudothermotoga thermarum]|uniref:Glutamine--fructose-6-phosphate aminotransferase [isomerizing] n=1 Tax=Pseudothermotoga thermarum DSM 5069 TaxID=688269 RepID=F7YUV2_9THEM|nr:glutamine--fructose-6-phosphate transaminase (isomerizing) [Pseudothermotoga thermarum]AEH51512.1 sugar isomerase (SIS) [Pseudothermotoga thermarum DSM 5069]